MGRICLSVENSKRGTQSTEAVRIPESSHGRLGCLSLSASGILQLDGLAFLLQAVQRAQTRTGYDLSFRPSLAVMCPFPPGPGTVRGLSTVVKWEPRPHVRQTDLLGSSDESDVVLVPKEFMAS